MILIFLKFLRNICRIDEKRLRAYLYCYPNQDVNSLTKYWSKLTGISLSQFTRPYIRKDFSLGKKDRMKNGLIHIRYCDKKLLFQIQKWIRQYLDKII